ncbi:hypothetical protein vseg_020935 [Gypsophila vaccaria]
MARKSNMQKQRELNLRGRNIVRINEEETNEAIENNMNSGPSDGVPGKRPDVEIVDKARNLHELLGIPELEIETDEEDEVEEETGKTIVGEKQSINVDSVKQPEKSHDNTNMLQIMQEDVEEEIDYWKQAVICYIFGANPPWEVIEGFIRRIWTKFNIDKISFMNGGIFLVRFKTMEMMEKVLQSGYYLFDSKPLIYRPWAKDMVLQRTEVTVVPMWIQFHNLPLKFWGKSLPKITGLVEKYVKQDVATAEITRIGYARVMVELHVDQNFPAQVSFLDENGNVVKVDVEYEWKPITCGTCNGMGHHADQCRKGKPQQTVKKVVKKVWKPVTKEGVTKTQTVDEERIVQVTPRQPRRLINMNQSKEAGKEGFSSRTFGSLSYKEVLSPSKQPVDENVESFPPKPPYG